MTFQEMVKAELTEMGRCGIIGKKRAQQARELVDADPTTYSADSGMSRTEAASLAAESV